MSAQSTIANPTVEQIVRQLFNSGTYDFTTDTRTYSGPVVELVREIAALAETRGMTLSRWQTNKSTRATVITYTIHSGERASQARYQSGVVDSIVLTAIEGKTARCEAYMALTRLRAALA